MLSMRNSRSEHHLASMPSTPSSYSGSGMSHEKQSFSITRSDSSAHVKLGSNGRPLPVPFQLTSHERLMLARQNIGAPQVITHAVRYPLGELPSSTFLGMRVSDLQFHLPRLNVSIGGARTSRPHFENGAPWAVNEIVEDSYFLPNPHNDLDAEMASILHTLNEAFTAQDFDHGPMFRVSVLTSPEREYGYLVANFNHLMVDGRGSLRLLHLLTSPGVNLPIEAFEKAARLDDTLDIKPDARYLAPIVFREIIVPKLPKPLQKKWKSKDAWPAERIGAHPADVPGSLSFTRVSAEIVEGCKRAGKSRGVRTFHPILKMAYMSALWRVFGAGSTSHGNSLRLCALSSRDERRTRSGHSAITGCYVTNPEYHTKLSGGDKFWSSARALSQWMCDRGVFIGRYNNGALNGIPDDVSSNDPNYDPGLHPTGWEQYCTMRAGDAAPYRTSLALHNLGVAQLPQGAEDHAWTQSASPYGPVWHINVVSHEGGLRLSAAYRDGSAVTKNQTDALLDILQVILERVAFDEADTTVERLTA